MEETVYYGVIAAMIIFGLYAGNRWARSMGQAMLLGLAGSAVAVAAFLCLIAALAIFPHLPGMRRADTLEQLGRFWTDVRPALAARMPVSQPVTAGV